MLIRRGRSEEPLPVRKDEAYLRGQNILLLQWTINRMNGSAVASQRSRVELTAVSLGQGHVQKEACMR